jgi:2,4-diketo-3-deoxy-L-fuconate hydrolase
MKLIRFGNAGEEKAGVHIDGVNYDASFLQSDYDEQFFARGGLPNWKLT